MLAAIGLTRGVRLLALLGLGAVLVGLASLCVFTVDAGEYAVVTQFGKPVRVESTPGLKFKLPAPVSAFGSTAPGGYRAEAILGGVSRQYRELALRDYGIDVVDVGLRRLDFPEQNRASVFARMKSERVRISMRFRSEGEEEGLKVRAASEKAKSGILGEAYKLSQQIRGEGEARGAQIYTG